MTRAAVYARISDDRAGAGLGVARQREDCERLCERRGWTVVDTYVDNDLSAYSGKPRPEYDRLLEDVRAGHVTAIVAWHPDRLHRSTRELEDFIDAIEESGATVETVTAGTYDLSTPSGRMTARILGATARHESEHKSERLRRKALELAEAGAVGGGGTRPFGFEADRVTVREDEAALVREAAGRVLAGETLHAVLTDWNARGVTTVTGRPWRTTTLRRLLTAPRVAGLREHRGEVVGPAVWAAIIDRDHWERLRARVLDPGRRKGGRPREYLLTGGIAVCGVCGADLVARPRAGHRSYVCAKGVNFAGCGKIRMKADPFEAEVRDQVIAALAGPGLRAALEADDDGDQGALYDRLRADEEALHALEVDFYTEGALSKAGYLAAREKLAARIEETRSRLARTDRSGVLADLPESEDALRAEWQSRSVAWRRSLVAALVESVEVGPAVQGRNFFDPERVSIVWRG